LLHLDATNSAKTEQQFIETIAFKLNFMY